MADSTENNKNLDSYGVWVKRPPQDAKTETTEASDFSDLDSMFADSKEITDPAVTEDSFDSLADNDTTLSDEELSNIAGDINLPEKDATIVPADDMFESFDTEPKAEESPATDSENTAGEENQESGDAGMEEFSVDDFLSDTDFANIPDAGGETPAAETGSSDISESGDGEISLDDFMDGGFTDPNPGAAPDTSASTSDEISLDDFLDEDSSKAKEDDVTNDEALDIDLSFTDSPDNQVPVEEVSSDDTASDSDFEDSFAAQEETPASEQNSEVPALDSTMTEEISLEDFGLDENSDDATAVAAGAAVNSSADSEDVDLSDFGIDSDAEETPVKQDVQGAKKKQVVDYDIAITEDDAVATAPTAATVPDRLEEETTDVLPDSSTPVPDNSTVVDNSILDQIMAELSGLKSQINNLKDEFEDLKNKDTISVSETNSQDDNAASVITESSEPEVSTGFFDNSDEDETIALSGDELSNIMNTADFTETSAEETAGTTAGETETAEPSVTDSSDFEISESITEPEIPDTLPEDTVQTASASEDIFEDTDSTALADDNSANEVPVEETISEPIIESDSGLSMGEEKLEEPDFDSIENEESAPLPDVDDIAPENGSQEDSILVESSNTDLMNSVNDSTDQFNQMAADTAAVQESSETPEAEALPNVDDIAGDNSETALPPEGEKTEQDVFFNDIMTADVEVKDGISEANIDYLKDEPVEDMTSSETPVLEEAAAQKETFPEPAAENTALPDDLKSDVKSVLLYMDQLLENLPEDKILEFAKSEQFSTYKKLFSELGLS